jgi:hypothetical protein
MPKKKPPRPELLTCIVEDILVGAVAKYRRADTAEVSIRVHVVDDVGEGPAASWMRVHPSLAFRLRALADTQGADGLMGRCCTIGVDEHGLVVSLQL